MRSRGGSIGGVAGRKPPTAGIERHRAEKHPTFELHEARSLVMAGPQQMAQRSLNAGG